jgi:hypothetical protein
MAVCLFNLSTGASQSQVAPIRLSGPIILANWPTSSLGRWQWGCLTCGGPVLLLPVAIAAVLGAPMADGVGVSGQRQKVMVNAQAILRIARQGGTNTRYRSNDRPSCC